MSIVIHEKLVNKNVLFLTNTIRGLFSFRREVIQAIVENGCNVYISCPDTPGEQHLFFEKMGCTIIQTPFKRRGTNPLADFRLMLSYRRLIKSIKPDVVLSYTIKPNLYGGLACGICHVPQIANITGLGSAVENKGWLQTLTFFLYKICMRKTSVVFFQNNANKLFCERHNIIKGDKRLIPGSGVNLQYHTFQPYPIDQTPLRFIFVGRLLHEKGIDQYLKAAEVIKSKYPNTEFHVLGASEDSYREKLELLEKKSIVIYHGRQADVRPFFCLSHCTIHPSFYPEGMSNVLLESCAAGRPIITTNRPGCGEVLDDGINGYLVNQRDTNDLVSKIEKFIHLPYEAKQQMGKAARLKVEREFDRQTVVQAYMEAISQLI